MKKHCKKCKKEYETTDRWNSDYCNRSCSNSRIWTNENRKHASDGILNSVKAKAASLARTLPKIEKRCCCGETFFVRPSGKRRQFCSNHCSIKFKRHLGGGYREGSGRSKSGYYKGVYCGSTYELCWLIYQQEHDVKFSRFPGLIQNETLKYFPDFLMDDGKTIIEIKGYENKEKVAAKTALAKSLGYEVKVLYKADLKACFEYVKEKYGTSKFFELYDDYKPKYTGVCSLCNIEFARENKIKTKTAFCSRTCAMKYNAFQAIKKRDSLIS